MNRSHPPIYTPVEQYHTAARPHYEAKKTDKGGPGWDLLSLAGLILPLGFSIFLFHTTLEDVRGTGVEIVEWVSENRSVIAIFVQIVSGILGLITVKAIVTLINLRTRLSLVKKPMNLDRLAFWASICLQRPDWQISKSSFAATAAFVAACSSIAALWAGAITPVLTSDAPFNVSIQVPAYDDLTVLTGGGDGFDTVTEPMGLFTFHPGFRIPGVIVAAARDATSRSGYANSHDKLDKTGYTYSTRSFGAGATVGLADVLLDQGGQSVNSTAVSYKYREKGPVVKVSCGRNESHEVLFYEMSDRPESWTLHVYNMEAYMPDGTARLAAATSLGPDEAFVLAVGGLVDARSYFTLVPDEKAGNSRYARVKDVQCTLDFSETTFDVSVDVLNRTITVVDDYEHQPLDDKRILVEFGIRKLSEVSSALMTSVWTNLMGDAFINNIANVDAFEGNRERATLRGVEMAIESMVDSVLESLSAAQFKILNDRQKVDADVLYKGVRVGDRAFIYAVLVISVSVVLATMMELCATRVWRGTPAFDFTRIVHVAVAASAGGTSLADSKMSGHDGDACRVSLVIPDPRSTVGRLEDVWQ